MVAAAQQQVYVPNAAKTEPYPFTDEMERALVTLLASRPSFYAKLGPNLDPKAFNSPVAKLALEAVRAIAHDTGRGPDKLLIVTQRLRRWMGDGKLQQDDITAVSDMFDEAEDAGLPEEDTVIAEVAPILQRRAQREAIESALADYQKRQDPSHAFQILEKASLIGVAQESSGTLLGEQSFASLERVRNIERLPIGIMEVDEELLGGFYRGTETVYIAGTGGGKSQALIQNATAAALRGFFVGYITLELPEPIILARIKSNLTGVLVDDIMLDPETCRAPLMSFLRNPLYGGIVVGEFTPKVTSVADLRAWVKREEAKHGRRMDVLVVDYADKLGASRGYKKKGQDEENTYHSSLDVYEELRIWANEERRWVFTASQSTRAKDKGKKLGVDDVADSMHKVRVADYVITLNPRDEGATLLWHLAKNRLGKNGANIGPLPVHFETARIGPITWPDAYVIKQLGSEKLF